MPARTPGANGVSELQVFRQEIINQLWAWLCCATAGSQTLQSTCHVLPSPCPQPWRGKLHLFQIMRVPEGNFILGPTERCRHFPAGLGMFLKQELGEPPVAFASWRMPRRDLLQPSSDKAAIPELELLECQQGPHTGNISMRKRSNGTQQLQPPWAGLHCHPEPGKGDRERRHFLGHLHS